MSHVLFDVSRLVGPVGGQRRWSLVIGRPRPRQRVRYGRDVHVAELWRYPVKSMIGSTVDAVELDELGIVGDRTWATRDLERGGIRGAKKIGELMQFAARDLPDGHVEITLPDGSTATTLDDDVDDRVSAALGHQVRLERLRPADDLEHYRRGAPDGDDPLAEFRAVMGREADDPLPDFSVFPPRHRRVRVATRHLLRRLATARDDHGRARLRSRRRCPIPSSTSTGSVRRSSSTPATTPRVIRNSDGRGGRPRSGRP